MLSGGSFVSWSVSLAAKTVAVQLSPCVKSESGSSVKDVGPPEAVAVCVPLATHEIEYHEPVTLTGSLKVIATFEPTGMPEAPSPETVLATLGAVSALQSWNGEAVFRGVGAPVEKSAALLSLSMQPEPFRRSAFVFDGAGAAPGPSKQLAVVP